jgi:hypothetical protein
MSTREPRLRLLPLGTLASHPNSRDPERPRDEAICESTLAPKHVRYRWVCDWRRSPSGASPHLLPHGRLGSGPRTIASQPPSCLFGTVGGGELRHPHPRHPEPLRQFPAFRTRVETPSAVSRANATSLQSLDAFHRRVSKSKRKNGSGASVWAEALSGPTRVHKPPEGAARHRPVRLFTRSAEATRCSTISTDVGGSKHSLERTQRDPKVT